MATLATFQNPDNLLKVKFEINFGTGFENWTNYLLSFDFLQELSEISYGICQTEAYFELKVPSPDPKWTKQGLPVKFTISITDDKGASFFDYVVFEGKTARKTTISNMEIKIKANDRLHELMAKEPPFRGHFSNFTLAEINSLITNTWPGQAISFTDKYNYSIKYLQSDDDDLGSQVLEFAKISACMVIFENNTIKFINGEKIAIDNVYTLEGDIPLSKIGMGDYNVNAKLDKSEYFNVFKATGYQYIDSVNYCDQALSGYAIPSATETFLEVDLGTTLAINLGSVFIFTNNIDADTPSNPAGLSFISQSITANNKVLFKLYNPNGFTIYLRRVKISGLAVIQTGTFSKIWENTAQIAADGEKITFEIESKVAQSINNLDNLILIQQAFTNEYYEFKCAWSPNFKVGKVITARTTQNNIFYGIITKAQAGISLSDPRLTATIKLRKFVP